MTEQKTSVHFRSSIGFASGSNWGRESRGEKSSPPGSVRPRAPPTEGAGRGRKAQGGRAVHLPLGRLAAADHRGASSVEISGDDPRRHAPMCRWSPLARPRAPPRLRRSPAACRRPSQCRAPCAVRTFPQIAARADGGDAARRHRPLVGIAPALPADVRQHACASPPRRASGTKLVCSTCRRTSTSTSSSSWTLERLPWPLPPRSTSSTRRGRKRLNVSRSDIVKQRVSSGDPLTSGPNESEVWEDLEHDDAEDAADGTPARGRATCRSSTPTVVAALLQTDALTVVASAGRSRGARGRAASSRCGSRCTSRWRTTSSGRSGSRASTAPPTRSSAPSSTSEELPDGARHTASTTSTRTRTTTATALPTASRRSSSRRTTRRTTTSSTGRPPHAHGGRGLHGPRTRHRQRACPARCGSPRSRSSSFRSARDERDAPCRRDARAAPGARPHLKAVTQAEQVWANDEQFCCSRTAGR